MFTRLKVDIPISTHFLLLEIKPGFKPKSFFLIPVMTYALRFDLSKSSSFDPGERKMLNFTLLHVLFCFKYRKVLTVALMMEYRCL